MKRYIDSFHSPTIKGWLMKKARTGLRKTWTRRYFILESQQLRCYKNDQADSSPISVFDLATYELQNQPSSKPFTFQLIHQSSKSSSAGSPASPILSSTQTLSTSPSSASSSASSTPSPDLYLQAESEREWSRWIDTLERHVGDQPHLTSNTEGNVDLFHPHDEQVDVLDKWLERYDLIVPNTDRFTPSLLSLAPSSAYGKDDDDIHNNSNEFQEELTVVSPRSPTFDHQQQQQQPLSSASSLASTNTTSKATSAPRFLGFLWTMNTKKSKAAQSSPSTSSTNECPSSPVDSRLN